MTTKRFHVNPETGTPGTCNPIATGKCKYGTDAPHFDSEEAARGFYETTMKEETIGNVLQKSLRIQGLEALVAEIEAIEKIRSYALDLADDMDADPDYLPPIDDPAIEDGVDEEDGYITSLKQLKDPMLAAGNCITTAEAIKMFDEKFGYIEEEAGGPYLNVHAANTFTDELGNKWVVDYTYSQVDADAEWPYVSTVDEWRESVRNSGFSRLD